jgi:hypothetical protein
MLSPETQRIADPKKMDIARRMVLREYTAL